MQHSDLVGCIAHMKQETSSDDSVNPEMLLVEEMATEMGKASCDRHKRGRIGIAYDCTFIVSRLSRHKA